MDYHHIEVLFSEWPGDYSGWSFDMMDVHLGDFDVCHPAASLMSCKATVLTGKGLTTFFSIYEGSFPFFGVLLEFLDLCRFGCGISTIGV